MKLYRKTCPYCGTSFETACNARKYCRKKCAVLCAKKKTKQPKKYLCQWCGQLFKTNRKKKFCSSDCQNAYMHGLGILKKKVSKIPVKITLEDAAKGSKKEMLTYGRYVSIHKL